MEIFMGIPSLSRLISEDGMNGISSNLSDHSYPDIFHADNNERSLEGRMRACGSVGNMDHQEEPWCQPAPCEWDPGFLPRGVSLILTFGAGFSCLFQTKQLPSLPLPFPKWLHRMAMMQKVFNLKVFLSSLLGSVLSHLPAVAEPFLEVYSPGTSCSSACCWKGLFTQ